MHCVMYSIVSIRRAYIEVLFRRRSGRRDTPRVLLYYIRIIYFVLRSWYILLLLLYTMRERNDTMSPDVYSLISMSLCLDEEEDDTEGNTPTANSADQPFVRACVCRTNLLPAVFYVFWFYVRSGGVNACPFWWWGKVEEWHKVLGIILTRVLRASVDPKTSQICIQQDTHQTNGASVTATVATATDFVVYCTLQLLCIVNLQRSNGNIYYSHIPTHPHTHTRNQFVHVHRNIVFHFGILNVSTENAFHTQQK